ncbi:MAG: nucleoside hydrolase [Candidatus Brocadiales bacterium]|nr:nucleoside hydrolase [Candidatus Brocadiales bacterium]
MEKIKIIIDTDIGDDIDDAFALAYAANSEEVEILGVTTVFRNAEKRARMSCALLSSLGKSDIPVYAGIDKPLEAPILARKNDFWNEDGEFIPCQYLPEFDGFTYEDQDAVDYLIENLRKNPGEITLVPIGPLTNIAVAFRKAPDIIKKVKEVVLMGGCYKGDKAEWNILCDPEAAKIVFTSGAVVKAVGLDVTMKCRLDNTLLAEFRELSSKSCRLLSNLMDRWFEYYSFDNPVLHDPLTLAALIIDGVVKFTASQVKVLLDKEQYGRTIITTDEENFDSAEVWVATEVDERRFLSHFKERIFAF